MDMLSGTQLTAAKLTDWRNLGQGLHARFIVGDLRAGPLPHRNQRGRRGRRTSRGFGWVRARWT
jgi:hypothetical protein